MQRYLLNLFFSLLACAVFNACSDSDDKDAPEVPVTPPATAGRTVLVYMVADNSLGTRYGSDQADLTEMLQGVKGDNALNGGRLIVYHNRPGTNNGNVPQMLEVTPSGLKILKNYPDERDVYSVDPVRVSEVMADMKTLAPAEEYGLVLWSHANGWIGGSNDNDKYYRGFGEDRNYHISVQTLGKTLADERFVFVYFDCCLMGNIESIYELRHLAPVMVASPTELGIDGMPYHENVPLMFSPDMSVEDAMVQAAENTFNYYKEGNCRYTVNGEEYVTYECQMAVYDTAALDGLAEATRNIMATVDTYPNPFYVDFLQKYTKPGDSCFSVDMDNFMEFLAKSDYPDLYDAWRAEWRKVVLYGIASPQGIGGLNIYRYCGLGMFPIDRVSDITWHGYNTLQWWTDVVSAAPAYNTTIQ